MRRMRDRQRLAITSGMAVALMTGSALAAGSGPGSNEGDDLTLEAMAKRLADLEKQNDTLQGRVRELEAADGELWLTEQRATEIRGIVNDDDTTLRRITSIGWVGEKRSKIIVVTRRDSETGALTYLGRMEE